MSLPPWKWIGPRDDDLQHDGVTLLRPVPAERWPYGPREAHEDCCTLVRGGLFCDCDASAIDGAGEDGEG